MSQIVPLKCPSCGAILSVHDYSRQFGTELICNHCGALSLLIIDNTLIPRAILEVSGGVICSVCGRVARPEARFCQCGASLVRQCYWCSSEFPVDDRRCDECGWLDPSWGVQPAIEGQWKIILDLAPDKNFDYDSSGDDIPFIKLFHSIWFHHPDHQRYRARSGELLERLKDCYVVPHLHLKLFSLLFVEAGASTMELLKTKLESLDARVRGGAESMFQAIVKEGGPSFRASALSLLTSKATGTDQSTAAPANRVLQSMFSDLKDGHWGPTESRPFIEILTRSPNKEVASMATACLKKFGKNSWAPGG